MIVVGTDDPGAMTSTRLQIFEYSDDARYEHIQIERYPHMYASKRHCRGTW